MSLEKLFFLMTGNRLHSDDALDTPAADAAAEPHWGCGAGPTAPVSDAETTLSPPSSPPPPSLPSSPAGGEEAACATRPAAHSSGLRRDGDFTGCPTDPAKPTRHESRATNVSAWTAPSAHGSLTPDEAAGETGAGARDSSPGGAREAKERKEGRTSGSDSCPVTEVPPLLPEARAASPLSCAVVTAAPPPPPQRRSVCTAARALDESVPARAKRFGIGKPANPAPRFLAVLERYVAVYTGCGWCEDEGTLTPAEGPPLPPCDNTAAPARDRGVAEAGTMEEATMREFAAYLQYYRRCEKEHQARRGTTAVPWGWPSQLADVVAAQDWHLSQSLWNAVRELPTDASRCLAMANALVRHLTIVKTVPPPPMRFLSATVTATRPPAAHKGRGDNTEEAASLSLLPDCPCGCFGGFAVRSESAYVFHQEQYMYSNADSDAEAEYRAYRAHRLAAEAAGRRLPSADVCTPKANRSVVLPLLALQILSCFQNRVVPAVPEPRRCVVAQQQLSGEDRRHQYNQLFASHERDLIAGACVLLAWKQLDMSASAEFFLVGPTPPWLVSERPPPPGAAGAALARPRHHAFSTLRERCASFRRGRTAFLREMASVEMYVMSALDGRLSGLPLWWTAAVDTIEACFATARVGPAPDESFAEAMHQLNSLVQCLLAECPRRPASVSQTDPRGDAEVTQERAAVATREGRATAAETQAAATAPGTHTGPVPGVRTQVPNENTRFEVLLRHNPFCGVALAVVAGVPVEWAERHVLGIPSFVDLHRNQRRARGLAAYDHAVHRPSAKQVRALVRQRRALASVAAARTQASSSHEDKDRRVNAATDRMVDVAASEALWRLRKERASLSRIVGPDPLQLDQEACRVFIAERGRRNHRRSRGQPRPQYPPAESATDKTDAEAATKANGDGDDRCCETPQQTPLSAACHVRHATRMTQRLHATIRDVTNLTNQRSLDGRCYVYEERLARVLAEREL